MALSDILDAIRAESQETATGILAAAEAEAARLLDQAREEASREERRLAASKDEQARLERSRIISRAHLEAAQKRRAAREQVYLLALDGVVQRIEALRASPEYRAVLATLFDEAIAVLPSPAAVRVDPADVELVGAILAARDIDLAIEPEVAPLGGILVVAEGRTVDNTLRSRLERADEHLRYVAGELIPGLRRGTG